MRGDQDCGRRDEENRRKKERKKERGQPPIDMIENVIGSMWSESPERVEGEGKVGK